LFDIFWIEIADKKVIKSQPSAGKVKYQGTYLIVTRVSGGVLRIVAEQTPKFIAKSGAE